MRKIFLICLVALNSLPVFAIGVPEINVFTIYGRRAGGPDNQNPTTMFCDTTVAEICFTIHTPDIAGDISSCNRNLNPNIYVELYDANHFLLESGIIFRKNTGVLFENNNIEVHSFYFIP